MDQSATLPLLGLIGHKIAGNPTQFAIEQALRAAQLDWRFLSFEISPEGLAAAIAGVDVLGFRGLMLADPYESQVQTLVPHSSALAATTGWVDTLSRDAHGKMLGHHLLGEGLQRLVGSLSLAGAEVAVLGSSAKTIALAGVLLALGAGRLYVPQLTAEAGLQLVTQHAKSPAQVLTQVDDEEAIYPQLALVLRGNLQGASEEPARFAEEQIDQLGSECMVIDLAIPASSTPLLRYAAERGHPTWSAIDLLVQRATLAFTLWTGQAPHETTLREAFEEFLEI